MPKGRWIRIPLYATLIFLYVPILVLVVMSFNSSSSPFSWGGFGGHWYVTLIHDQKVLTGLLNTIIVAVGAMVLSTALGTLLAVGLQRHTRSPILQAFALAPAIIPDLVLGIGLLAFYSLVSMTLGLHSVLIAHVVFGTAFVTAVVRARLDHVDPSLEEAFLPDNRSDSRPSDRGRSALGLHALA
jgi:spermidine/putrescine transport system permease protein